MDVAHTDKQPSSLPSSPLSELSSSDSETYNTSTSRVHFGPLRSPEKRFIATGLQQQIPPSIPLHSQHQQESLPHAPHILSLQEQDSSDDNPEEDFFCHSRSGTPENVPLPPDELEPSSVLATRIIRAHDNPSPPPRAVRTLHTPIQVDKDAELPSVGIFPPSPTSPALVVAQGSHEHRFPLPPPSPSPSSFSWNQAALPALFRDSINLSPSPKMESYGTHSQEGPTSCDSFAASVANTSHPKPLLMTEPSTHSEHLSGDQLPPQPADHIIKSVAMDCSASESLQEMLTTNLPSDSQGNTLAETSCFKVGQVASSAVQEHRGDASYFAAQTTPVLGASRSQSPIRRSTRPRRGVSPFHTTSNGNSTPDQQLSQHADGLLTVPSPAQTQKKNKSRSVSPASTSDLDMENSNRNRTESVADSVDPITREWANPQPQESPKRMGKRRDVNGTESSVKAGDESPLRRQLGSLSPSSAVFLTQLIPSTDALPIATLGLERDESTQLGTQSTQPSHSFGFAFPLVSQQHPFTVESQIPDRSDSPVRFTSPVHSTRRSPVKIQPMDIDDPNRTPARRIPLEQAVVQGQISLQKAMQLASRPPDQPVGSQVLFPHRTPVFSFRPEMHSPARRIPVSEATPVKSRGPMSPIRAPVKERSRSVEPRPLQTSTTRIVRSASVDYPKPPTTTAATNDTLLRAHALPPIAKSVSRHQLPYPLAPLREHSIPEEVEPPPSNADESDTATVKPTSPSKSNLKQASSVSRIPRIGIKPYAKPATIAATTTSSRAKEGRTPGIMRRVDLTLNGTTSGNPRSAPPSASNGGRFPHSTVGGAVPSLLDRPMIATARKSLAGSSTSPLKRKRGPDMVPSPVKGPSARVAPLNSRQQGSKHPPGDMRGSPQKKKDAPTYLRKVADLPKEAASDKLEEEHTSPVNQLTGPGEGETSTTTQQIIDNNTPTSNPLTSHPTDGCAPTVNDISTNFPPANPHETSNAGFIPNLDLYFGRNRRTTRQRKVVTTNRSVDVSETSDRPQIHRRRVALSSYESDVFSGMSAVALRALTSSNTTRNQVYWTTKLETEVIRKEGTRPDSPTVKVKTIIQRREEEKVRQRQERAARRARRSDDLSDFNDVDGPQNAQPPILTDADSDLDEQDICPLLKHQRAPGDEDDYKTPVRAKRAGSGEEDVEKKRVKWDRSLSTAVFVDDVLPRPRARSRGAITVKGCLAKTAKTLRLDNLGNLQNVDTPLTDLVRENIVVKKFVYDNDPEPGPMQATTPKNTKSRSKKTKS